VTAVELAPATTIGAPDTTTTMATTALTSDAPTTIAAVGTPDPDRLGVEGAVVRAATVNGLSAPAEVEPASDTLPVTGAANVAVAVVGLVLLSAGLVILCLARREPIG
jgi:LPXTG-motif cell wall-anchored protein